MMMLVCNMFYANATHTYSHYYYTFYTAFRKRKTSELTMRIIVLHLESNARDSCTDKNAIMVHNVRLYLPLCFHVVKISTKMSTLDLYILYTLIAYEFVVQIFHLSAK